MKTPLIDCKTLAAWMEGNVKLIDATWFMPQHEDRGHRHFERHHIAGACFFDLDGVVDRASPFPHMRPSLADWQRAMGALGIGFEERIVVYDGAGMFSAPHVWWRLRSFGHTDCFILDGGLPLWQRFGGAIETGAFAGAAVASEGWRDAAAEFMIDYEELRKSDAQVVDARSAARFAGREKEPRAGLRSGHMPQSVNIPYGQVLDAQGLRFLDAGSLGSLLGSFGDEDVVTSCGSGVTACVLGVGFWLVGKRVRVFDGSWAQWGAMPDAPVARDA